MDEFIPDDCKRLYFGTSLFSSASADISSIFDVDNTHAAAAHRPNTSWSPSFGLEEWMFEEREEDAAGRMDRGDHLVSCMFGDLCRDELQLALNCTVDSLLAGEGENVHSCDHDRPMPNVSSASFDFSPSPQVGAVNGSSSSNNKSDPQVAATSSASSVNANLPDLNKIIVYKPILDKAVQRLGGGANGAQKLWELIQYWLKLGNASTSFELPSLPNYLENMLFQESDSHVENAASFEVIGSAMDASPISVPIIIPGESVVVGTSATATASAACESPMMGSLNMCASRAGCSATAATTRAARKHRMARQRRSHNHTRPASSSSRSGFATLPASGTCNHDRKKESQSFVSNMTTREGVPIAMEDMTALQMWNFRSREKQGLNSETSLSPTCGRFWPNNKSRMYLLENTGTILSP